MFKRYILLLMLGSLCSFPVCALDFKLLDIKAEDGEPLQIGKIKILSVLRLFPVSMNQQDMVELSGLAWSEDENILYAVNDHGSLFHFRPSFSAEGMASIELLSAYPLRDAINQPVGYPWSDSEGLHVKNGDNGIQGDDELLVSFENKPRLQWHRPDGSFIRKQHLPAWLEDKSSYYRRSKALESVTIHPELGVITTPEYPMEDADWGKVTLYFSDGRQKTVSRDSAKDMAVCALEVLPGGGLLMLKRKRRVFAPTWAIELQRLQLNNEKELQVEILANMTVGGVMPVDNYEGLTRHAGNRFMMISDDNEHFMQRTLLVYFELVDAE